MKDSPDQGSMSSPQSLDASRPKSSDGDVDSSLLVEKLLTYEAAARTQDADFQATCAHLRPLYATLIFIGQKGVKADDQHERKTTRRANKQRKSERKSGFLGFGSNKSSSTRSAASASSSEVSNVEGDQSKCHLSYDDIAYAYKSLTCSDNQDAANTSKDVVSLQTTSNIELIKADRQLMYMLQQLERFKSDTKPSAGTTNKKITFPEFVQCYRIVVGGMQTIQYISGNSTEEDLFRMKKRMTDRISVLINAFGPDGYRTFVDSSTVSPRSPSKKSSPLPSPLSKSSGGSGIYKLFGSSIVDSSDDDMETAGELEEEIDYLRRLLAVKDKQLVRTLSDHADNMESLGHEGRQRDEAIRRYIRKKRRRRKRMRRMMVVALLCIVLLCYQIGIIRVVVVNRVPRPSIHLSEFTQIFSSMSDNEISEMKQSSLKKSYRIENLENEQSALKAELKAVKVSLELANDDLRRSAKELLKAQKAVGSESFFQSPPSSLALDSCRTEMRKVREEAAMLRLERNEKCEQQQQQSYAYSEYLQKFLLGPFQARK